MNIITRKTALFKIVDQNVIVLPILNNFGIKLGFGNKTIEEVCREYQINIDFFLSIVNTIINDNYFPGETLGKVPSSVIINYLKNTHHYYLSYLLIKLEKLIERIIEKNIVINENIRALSIFYKKFKWELEKHIDEEEKYLFPIFERYEKIHFHKQEILETKRRIDASHINVEEKLNDLKAIIIRHLNLPDTQYLIDEFLILLYRFHADLGLHEKIEDKVLIPHILSDLND